MPLISVRMVFCGCRFLDHRLDAPDISRAELFCFFGYLSHCTFEFFRSLWYVYSYFSSNINSTKTCSKLPPNFDVFCLFVFLCSGSGGICNIHFWCLIWCHILSAMFVDFSILYWYPMRKMSHLYEFSNRFFNHARA